MKSDKELTSFDGLVEGNDGYASLTDHSDRNVRKPSSQPEAKDVADSILLGRLWLVSIWLLLSIVVVSVKLSPAYRTVLAATLDELDYTEPMEAMITRQPSGSSHLLFANGTIIHVGLAEYH